MELAVLRLGDVATVGGEATVSFCTEFRDSHENGLVSLREGAAGGAGAGVRAGAVVAVGLPLGGESAVPADGDHGIEGSELVMLLMEIFFLGSFSMGAGCSAVW